MKRINILKLSLILVLTLGLSNIWGQTVTLSYTGTMQNYTVPAGVNSIQIVAKGAQGGSMSATGGLGATIQGDFTVTPGQVLKILVGQQGLEDSPYWSGGGGGSFVTDITNSPLVVAGGGGGASAISANPEGLPGVITTNGTDGGGGTVFIGGGGLNGGGGGGGVQGSGGGGGGLLGNGGDGLAGQYCGVGGAGGNGVDGADGSCGGGLIAGGGQNFINGGAGGLATSGNAHGGYGGGGAAVMWNVGGGGGGGYSGGGGGAYDNASHQPGGGGGSFNGGTSQVNVGGNNTGNGQVIITVLCSGLTASASVLSLCDGDLLTLNATSSNGGTITWDNGATNGVPFVPLTTGLITYTATSSSILDCSFSIDVTVDTVPNVIASVDNNNICLGDTVIFTGSGTLTYAWDNGVTDGALFSPVASGNVTYTVTGTGANGCTNTSSVDVLVNEVIITYVSSDEMFGNDGAIDITVTGGTIPYVFDWDNDGTSDFDDSEDLAGLAPGTFTVVVVDDNGCEATEVIIIDTQLGIPNGNDISIEVYPNPTTHNITIQLEGNFTYELMTMSGKIILNGMGEDTKSISMENLSSGTYLINIVANNSNKVVRIVKQ